MTVTAKPGAPAEAEEPLVVDSAAAALGTERSSAGMVVRRFLGHRMAVAGLVIVVLMVLMAVSTLRIRKAAFDTAFNIAN